MIKDNDFILWPDGDWCYGSELPELDHKEGEYSVLKYKSKDWNELYIKEVRDNL